MAKTDSKIFTPEFGTLSKCEFLSLKCEQLAPHLVQTWHFLTFLSGDESYFTFKTSGSTGTPKTINISKSSILASAESTTDFLELRHHTDGNVLVVLPTEKIAGAMLIARAFVANQNLVLLKPKNNPLSEKWLSQFENFSLLSMVPHQFEMSLNEETSLEIINRCENILLGGAPVSTELALKTSQLHAKVYETFGMTETVSHIALKKLNGDIAENNLFKVLNNIQISSDVESRLMIKGEVTGNEWIITDDRVKIESENSFLWLGRSSNVINSGGVKIQAEEIENTLLNEIASLKSRRLVVFPIKDPQFGQRPVLVVEGAYIQGIENHVKAIEFPKFHSPHKILFMEKLPETPNMKIDRLAVIKLFNEE